MLQSPTPAGAPNRRLQESAPRETPPARAKHARNLRTEGCGVEAVGRLTALEASFKDTSPLRRLSHRDAGKERVGEGGADAKRCRTAEKFTSV